MKQVKFVINISGGAEILKNNLSLESVESDIMGHALSAIEAQFFQTFGVEGKFRIVGFTTDRLSQKIQADDARTAIILKKNPGWLGQFVDNMQI